MARYRSHAALQRTALLGAVATSVLGGCDSVLDVGGPVALATSGSSASASGTAALCGNGRVEFNEDCDDGNLVDDDGCTRECKLGGDFACNFQPSVCFSCPASSTGCGPLQQARCCDVAFVPPNKPNADFVPSFYLDKFEVTVERFRLFLPHYVTWISTHACTETDCPPGSVPQKSLPASELDLRKDVSSCTQEPCACNFSESPGGGEAMPVNCVSFFVASAFCAWEGGRLPTRAEWHSAASNGTSTDFPWGTKEPAKLGACDVPDFANFSYTKSPGTPVTPGSQKCDGTQQGVFDLSGNLAEWAVTAAPSEGQVALGGSFRTTDIEELKADFAAAPIAPTTRRDDVGFRCAHDVPRR